MPTEKNKSFLRELNVFESTEQGRAFTQFLHKQRVKLVDALIVFLKKISQEAVETKDAGKLLGKYVTTGHLSEEEGEEFRKQMYDVLKMLGIGVPFFLIPGSSLLMPLLVKLADKYDIKLLPSAFNEQSDDKKTDLNQ